jgi:hypothetical protein
VIIQRDGIWSVGVLAFDLQAEDFFCLPVELEAQQVLQESTAMNGATKNPHGLRISACDSGRTRTYNQLIITQLGKNASQDSSLTSRLKIRAAHCRKRKQIA